MILVIGQYSTGKTTFISHILEEEYPGSRIGPEPTTDKFIAICKGDTKVIPGNVAIADTKLPWKSLERFGNTFMQRFQVSMSSNKVLDHVTIVDTPGILSGEKQRVNRGYDFTAVLKSLADQADVIILLFDAHKLDISDEYKRCLEAIISNDEKIKVVLNKADGVGTQEMMRIFGALMWSLSRVFNCPEVPRVYVSSFWDKPYINQENRSFFTREKDSLYSDIMSLPKTSVVRKLNDMLKRARNVLAFASVMAHVKKTLPMMGKQKAKDNMTKDLKQLYEEVRKDPLFKREVASILDDTIVRTAMREIDFGKLKKFDKGLFDNAQAVMDSDIPGLMVGLPQEYQEKDTVKGGVFNMDKVHSVFGTDSYEGYNEGMDEPDWIVGRHMAKYDVEWRKLATTGGKLKGAQAKKYFTTNTKLTNTDLSRMWSICDVDQDNALTRAEFALACYVVALKEKGYDIPSKLPDHLRPPPDEEEQQPPNPQTPQIDQEPGDEEE